MDPRRVDGDRISTLDCMAPRGGPDLTREGCANLNRCRRWTTPRRSKGGRNGCRDLGDR